MEEQEGKPKETKELLETKAKEMTRYINRSNNFQKAFDRFKSESAAYYK